jgi:hypothetical protein
LRARRNQQEIARFLKRAQDPDLPFEESFEPKPDCWLGRCHSCPKFKKNVFGLTQTVDFVTWPPKTQPKSPSAG